MYIGQFSDSDLGTYADDFVAVDILLSIVYAYNSAAIDEQFSRFALAPPAVGYDLLKGPLGRPGQRQAEPLPLTSFVYIPPPSPLADPAPPDYREYYNLLLGYLPDSDPQNPEPYRDPQRAPTKFTFSGDPVSGTSWIDGDPLAPGERRFLMSSGPFTMALGDTQEIIIAPIAGLGNDNLTSISSLQFIDRAIQSLYDHSFELPKPPAPPKLTISELGRVLVLNWGEDPERVAATENKIPAGYEFEGYNVYQLPAKDAALEEAKKIATFDLVNEVTTILESYFEPNTGYILQRSVQVGRNTGIKHYLILAKDYLRDRPIVNGRPYYFAVTAYNYNSDNPLLPSLETPLDVQVVIPHIPKPGLRFSPTVGDTLEVQPDGSGNGPVIPIVIDPSKTTGDTYRVSIRTDTQGLPFWNLFNETTDKLLFKNQTNFSGDDNYPLVDGLLVKVVGSESDSADFFFTSQALTFNEILARQVFAGTDNGVFVSLDNGETWKTVGEYETVCGGL